MARHIPIDNDGFTYKAIVTIKGEYVTTAYRYGATREPVESTTRTIDRREEYGPYARDYTAKNAAATASGARHWKKHEGVTVDIKVQRSKIEWEDMD